MPANTLLTAAEAARRLGISPATLKTWALEGRVPSIRATAKTVRFDWDEVVDALKQGCDTRRRDAARG